jgi:hypothetical protein
MDHRRIGRQGRRASSPHDGQRRIPIRIDGEGAAGNNECPALLLDPWTREGQRQNHEGRTADKEQDGFPKTPASQPLVPTVWNEKKDRYGLLTTGSIAAVEPIDQRQTQKNQESGG